MEHKSNPSSIFNGIISVALLTMFFNNYTKRCCVSSCIPIIVKRNLQNKRACVVRKTTQALKMLEEIDQFGEFVNSPKLEIFYWLLLYLI